MRERVWRQIQAEVRPGGAILDVGCGVGTDAAWMVEQGWRVVGLDASSGMVAEAGRRAPGARIHHLPAERVGALEAEGPFDAALLNFGVPNVVDLRRVAAGLRRCLRPGARVFLVPMPRVNPAWMAGAIRRGRVGRAVQRLRPAVDVPVADGWVPTTYRSAGEVVRALAPWFHLESVRGLGLVLPPPGSRPRPGWMPRLAALDATLGRLPGLRHAGDHALLVFSFRPRPAAPPAGSGGLGRWSRRLAVSRRQIRPQVLILEVTQGCASRCVGCGYRGPAGGEALTPARAGALAEEARAMGATEVLLTGGEPLLRRDLGAIFEAVGAPGLSISLLTSGLGLRRRAALVAAHCDRVVLSLDGVDPEMYQAARGVDGFGAAMAGLAALRAVAPDLRIEARVTVTASNAHALVEIADRSAGLGFDGVSFLAADTETAGALGRAGPLSLPAVDLGVLRGQLDRLRDPGRRGQVLDSDYALERIYRHYAAAAGLEEAQAPRCDAPWTSLFVTADLELRPCFFLPADGEAGSGLAAALPEVQAQRADLDVGAHPTCARCVCWARLA